MQAFRVGRSGYGIQFHPEVTGETFMQWATVSDEAGDRSGIDVVVAAGEVVRQEEALAQTWRPVFHAFADVVHQS